MTESERRGGGDLIGHAGATGVWPGQLVQIKQENGSHSTAIQQNINNNSHYDGRSAGSTPDTTEHKMYSNYAKYHRSNSSTRDGTATYLVDEDDGDAEDGQYSGRLQKIRAAANRHFLQPPTMSAGGSSQMAMDYPGGSAAVGAAQHQPSDETVDLNEWCNHRVLGKFICTAAQMVNAYLMLSDYFRFSQTSGCLRNGGHTFGGKGKCHFGGTRSSRGLSTNVL